MFVVVGMDKWSQYVFYLTYLAWACFVGHVTNGTQINKRRSSLKGAVGMHEVKILVYLVKL